VNLCALTLSSAKSVGSSSQTRRPGFGERSRADVVLYKTLPLDPIRDLVPVTLVVNGLSVPVVNPGLPVKTVADMIAYAKANPNKLAFGSAWLYQ